MDIDGIIDGIIYMHIYIYYYIILYYIILYYNKPTYNWGLLACMAHPLS